MSATVNHAVSRKAPSLDGMAETLPRFATLALLPEVGISLSRRRQRVPRINRSPRAAISAQTG